MAVLEWKKTETQLECYEDGHYTECSKETTKYLHITVKRKHVEMKKRKCIYVKAFDWATMKKIN